MRPEEIERFFAARVVGPDALAMAIHERADGPTDRVVRVQPARRGQRLGAVPHHDRREGRVGPRLRHRGDPADARPRVRDASGCTGSRCSCSSSTSGPSAPIERCGFVVEGTLARVDLPRRPVVGRAGDERARVGLDSGVRATDADDAGRARDGARVAEAEPEGAVGAAASRPRARALVERTDPEVLVSATGPRGGRGARRRPRADRGQGPHGRQRRPRCAAGGRVRDGSLVRHGHCARPVPRAT